jgi:hypothetical protein
MPKKTGSRCGSELGFVQIHSWPSCDKHVRKKVGRKPKFASSAVMDDSESGEKHVHKVHPGEMPLSPPRRHHKAHLLKPRGIAGIFRGALQKVTRKKKI